MFTYLKRQLQYGQSTTPQHVKSADELLREAMDKAGDPDADAKRILCFFPAVASNPFQKILYSEAPKNGFVTVDVPSIKELRAYLAGLPQSSNRHSMNIHIHWVHVVLSGALSEAEAQEHSEQFLDDLTRLKAMGCRVIWTVHNIISHVPAYPEIEIALRQRLAVIADDIHIMNPATVDLCASKYRLDPAKCFHVPHPSYDSVYPNKGDTDAAHKSLKKEAGDKMILFFGTLAEFKGVRDLISVHQMMAEEDRSLILVIAGKAKDKSYLDVLKRAAAVPGVRLINRQIPDEEVQNFFLSADVVVCPYGQSLNSGVAMAALTFNRPLVVPTTLAHSFKEFGAVSQFTPFDKASLQTAIATGLSANSSQLDDKVFSDEHNAVVISDRFFSALRVRLAAKKAA